jgi:hypothetical protein
LIADTVLVKSNEQDIA